MSRIAFKPLRIEGSTSFADGEFGFESRFGNYGIKKNGVISVKGRGPSTWKNLDAPVRIYGAEVIGAPFHDDGSTASSTAGLAANPVAYDRTFGMYIPAPSINKNPFKAYGANDEFIYNNYSSHETVAGAAGTGVGSAYAPVKRNRASKAVLTFQNTDAQGAAFTDYYRCYYDIGIENFFTDSPYRDMDASYATAYSTAYLILTGSVVGGPAGQRTFVNVGRNSNGAYWGLHNYSRVDTNNDGIADTTAVNFAQRYLAGVGYAGFPESGSAQYTSGLVAAEGVGYSGSSSNLQYQMYENMYLDDASLGSGVAPIPRREAFVNQYKASWLVPVSSVGGNNNTFRIYNWGFADLIIEGFGIVYMNKPNL
jgi:hypothetical protein